jgi:hypothetical protein
MHRRRSSYPPRAGIGAIFVPAFADAYPERPVMLVPFRRGEPTLRRASS